MIDTGHPDRYPLKVNGVWRSTCSRHLEHWWQPIYHTQETR